MRKKSTGGFVGEQATRDTGFTQLQAPRRVKALRAACLILINDDYRVAEVGYGDEMQSRLGFEYEVLDSPIPTAPPSLIKGLGLRYRVFGSVYKL